MDRLPNELFPVIQKYLSRTDYRRLVTTSKLFSDIKFSSAMWQLNAHYSMEILTDPDFYNKVVSSMYSPSKQLIIFLLVPRHFVCITSHAWECYSLMVSTRYCDISVKAMNLFLKNFQNLSTFELMDYRYSLETLHLPCFDNLQQVRLIDCYEVHDISRLKDIPKLYLENLPNLIIIENMKTVDLAIIECESLLFVRNTHETIQHLQFHACDSIENTEGYEKIPNLVFYDCHNLSDISSLYQHDQVMIFSCPRIRKYPERLEMKNFVADCIYLNEPENEVDREQYGDQEYPRDESFSLDFIHLIDKIELLKLINITLTLTKPMKKLFFAHSINVHLILSSTVVIEELMIEHVNRFQISSEGEIHRLNMKNCDKVNLISNGIMQDCEMKLCHGITFTTINKLDSIKIIDSVAIGSLEQLNSVNQIVLKDCRTIRRVIGIENVKIVKIVNCAALNDISGLGKNEIVEISSCKKLNNFDSISNVPNVKIVDCGSGDSVEKTPQKKRKKRKFYHFN